MRDKDTHLCGDNINLHEDLDTGDLMMGLKVIFFFFFLLVILLFVSSRLFRRRGEPFHCSIV